MTVSYPDPCYNEACYKGTAQSVLGIRDDSLKSKFISKLNMIWFRKCTSSVAF